MLKVSWACPFNFTVMKLQLGKKTSDFVVVLYVLATLLVRFWLEPYINGHYWVSILIGLYGLLLLWALVKSKFLNPTWFGFFGGGNSQ